MLIRREDLERIRDGRITHAFLEAGMDKAAFKSRVRTLKGLGLTISLGTGYRISPRGTAVLSALLETRDRTS